MQSHGISSHLPTRANPGLASQTWSLCRLSFLWRWGCPACPLGNPVPSALLSPPGRSMDHQEGGHLVPGWNAESQAPPQIQGVRICIFSKIPRKHVLTLLSEKPLALSSVDFLSLLPMTSQAAAGASAAALRLSDTVLWVHSPRVSMLHGMGLRCACPHILSPPPTHCPSMVCSSNPDLLPFLQIPVLSLWKVNYGPSIRSQLRGHLLSLTLIRSYHLSVGASNTLCLSCDSC